AEVFVQPLDQAAVPGREVGGRSDVAAGPPKSRNSGKAGRQVVRLVVAAGHDHLVSALLATRLLLQAQRAVAEPAADQPPEVRGQVDITASSDLGHGQ